MSPKPFAYEWMTKYTHQEEWIEGRGVFLWLAFFFSEVGAGIYFVSLFLNFRSGWVTGWLLSLIVGGLVHLAYLGNPMRSWRVFLRPKSSELSRGLWAILLFAVFGFFQVLPVVIPEIPWSGENVVLKTITGILCILLITHGFLTMHVVKALAMWNSAMMIPLSLSSGICLGSQAVAFMVAMSGGNLAVPELWARWSLIAYTLVVGMFLLGNAHASAAARKSVQSLLSGELAVRFYVGILGIGIVVPLIITFIGWGAGLPALSGPLLFFRMACVVTGDLTMRHSVMKAAVYAPVI